MPHTHIPKKITPSTKGSRSVSEVLNRIPVRDASHKPSGVWGRRLTDFESRSPWKHALMLVLLAIVIAGSLWSGFLQKVEVTWNNRSLSSPKAEESLIIPTDLHPLP